MPFALPSNINIILIDHFNLIIHWVESSPAVGVLTVPSLHLSVAVTGQRWQATVIAQTRLLQFQKTVGRFSTTAITTSRKLIVRRQNLLNLHRNQSQTRARVPPKYMSHQLLQTYTTSQKIYTRFVMITKKSTGTRIKK